jgi:hypothetical protein
MNNWQRMDTDPDDARQSAEESGSRAATCSLPDNWLCDCTESEIRRVSEDHPHVSGIKGPGWFCMVCLTEFVKTEK